MPNKKFLFLFIVFLNQTTFSYGGTNEKHNPGPDRLF